ncbi:hypothetical protein MK805_05890 [Shimazuella sp. AN120528]|uniref:hypothetical protein n=1 Tax=Shimazuella soli TaxID=1892854 RepID=UPI001F0EA35B|nr:hypothetical protein [Shimazuella soli]MCH5584499.1 hypothetical protein [Shimazuella soli]
MTLKEPAANKYWIALGMIQPEWIYMSHFLEEEETEEELAPLPPITSEMRIVFHPRLD